MAEWQSRRVEPEEEAAMEVKTLCHRLQATAATAPAPAGEQLVYR